MYEGGGGESPGGRVRPASGDGARQSTLGGHLTRWYVPHVTELRGSTEPNNM